MANVQNDPGQQTPIKQGSFEPPDPKSKARTPNPLDDVTPPADPGSGRNAMVPSAPFKGI
jgi:hypothetical protein